MRRMMRIMKRHEGRFRLTESYANLNADAFCGKSNTI